MTRYRVGAGLVGLAIAAAVFATIRPAEATIITFNYDIEFSGATPPSGPAPWLTATFEDILGGVKLTLDTTGLTPDEFINGGDATGAGTGGWYFNFNPAETVGDLTFSFVSGNNADGILVGENKFQADGDGLYDIRFVWEPAVGSRLLADSIVVYNITGANLTADDFNFLSAPNGGSGPFTSAAHVMGIGLDAEDSGWVAPGNGQVPMPGTLTLLGSGLLALVAWRRFQT